MRILGVDSRYFIPACVIIIGGVLALIWNYRLQILEAQMLKRMKSRIHKRKKHTRKKATKK